MAARTLKIVCAVSLLLNVFLIAGVLAGTVLLRARPGRIVAGTLRIAGAELSPDTRRAFRHALRERRQALRPTILAGRQARADAATLLRAPALDQAALHAALARARAADFSVREGVEDRAIVFASTLSPADRAKLADGILRRQARRKPL